MLQAHVTCVSPHTVQNRVKTLLENLLFLLFPPACAACRTHLPQAQAGYMLCPQCLEDIEYIISPHCTVCGIPFVSTTGQDHVCGKCMISPPSFDSARAMFVYSGTVRKLIHRIKFQADGYALRVLCEMCRSQFQDRMMTTTVVPVPLHRARLRERGFNQAASLAGRLFPSDTISLKLLERTRNTRPQRKLSASQRHVNIRGAFRVTENESGPSVSGMKITLFDDILTTGSTVESAAGELRRAGALRVDVITVARAVQHSKI